MEAYRYRRQPPLERPPSNLVSLDDVLTNPDTKRTTIRLADIQQAIRRVARGRELPEWYTEALGLHRLSWETFRHPEGEALLCAAYAKQPKAIPSIKDAVATVLIEYRRDSVSAPSKTVSVRTAAVGRDSQRIPRILAAAFFPDSGLLYRADVSTFDHEFTGGTGAHNGLERYLFGLTEQRVPIPIVEYVETAGLITRAMVKKVSPNHADYQVLCAYDREGKGEELVFPDMGRFTGKQGFGFDRSPKTHVVTYKKGSDSWQARFPRSLQRP